MRRIFRRHYGTGIVDQIAHPWAANPCDAFTCDLSQAVFARYLNLTVGYVSQLERGTKQPEGATLTCCMSLNVRA